ncbi:hypothetical protein [Yonghaparkia sp. Root332]|uniref:hypothetical protein n=1 Tax=Yonghaparkia sp. Root332 TaxID=1736516 RepID=UPI0012E38972|nr:hypothetical protein [Yonghaparkia sp. Root332]
MGIAVQPDPMVGALGADLVGGGRPGADVPKAVPVRSSGEHLEAFNESSPQHHCLTPERLRNTIAQKRHGNAVKGKTKMERDYVSSAK